MVLCCGHELVPGLPVDAVTVQFRCAAAVVDLEDPGLASVVLISADPTTLPPPPTGDQHREPAGMYSVTAKATSTTKRRPSSRKAKVVADPGDLPEAERQAQHDLNTVWDSSDWNSSTRASPRPSVVSGGSEGASKVDVDNVAVSGSGLALLHCPALDGNAAAAAAAVKPAAAVAVVVTPASWVRPFMRKGSTTALS
jgi:hypothetical protein